MVAQIWFDESVFVDYHYLPTFLEMRNKMAENSKATEPTETPKKTKKTEKMRRTKDELDLFLRFQAYRLDAVAFQAEKRAREEKQNG